MPSRPATPDISDVEQMIAARFLLCRRRVNGVAAEQFLAKLEARYSNMRKTVFARDIIRKYLNVSSRPCKTPLRQLDPDGARNSGGLGAIG
jgi:hypothetical protein